MLQKLGHYCSTLENEMHIKETFLSENTEGRWYHQSVCDWSKDEEQQGNEEREGERKGDSLSVW